MIEEGNAAGEEKQDQNADAALKTLSPEQISDLLKNYPPTPVDVMQLVVNECQKRGMELSLNAFRVVLAEWVKVTPKVKELYNDFRVSNKTFKIVSSTISLWYKDSVGWNMQAFAEDNNYYYVIVEWVNRETKEPILKFQTVEKAHTK